MSNIVGIINYGTAGNLHSVEKAIKKANGQTLIINNVKQFNEVDKIVLPGVGSFKSAMQQLENIGFLEVLLNNTKPILGICLGMQILSTLGFEYGKTRGLGLIKAEVKPMLIDAKVPHVGFNNIEVIKTNSILNGLENEEFYFMHSFEVVNYTDVISLTQFAGHKFVSSIQKDNIFGVQFHPEKSGNSGQKFIYNWLKWRP